MFSLSAKGSGEANMAPKCGVLFGSGAMAESRNGLYTRVLISTVEEDEFCLLIFSFATPKCHIQNQNCPCKGAYVGV